MRHRPRLARRRGQRRYRFALIAFAALLMGASSGPSSCNGSGSGNSASASSTKVLIAGGEDSSGSILDSAELYDPSAGTFSYVGNSMSDGRAFQTATLLKDGRVLVAGGVNNGGSVIDSTDLYASSSSKFSATAAMTDPRQQFAATLLNNGEVLISGGLANEDSTSGLYTAELYEPSSNTFVAVGNMVDARSAQTSTLLKNGQVLIAGGISAAGTSFTGAELYDPSTNSFSSTGSLNDARAFHTATHLSSGKVLIAGGEDPSGKSVDTAELYDPSTGTFSAVGNMKAARQSHQATLLSDGEVLITGGETIVRDTTTVLDTAELYDPTTGKFTSAGTMTDGRVFHTTTLLGNGEVLLAGGEDRVGNPVDTAELYNPSSGAFTATTGTMKESRAFQTATLLK
jgi:hypothetical protein